MTKPIKIMLTALITLTIIGVITIVILLFVDSGDMEEGERTVEDMVENSFVTEEITTDLADGNFVRIQFRIVTDNNDASEELQQGDFFQLNDRIIQELTVMQEDDFRNELEYVKQQVQDSLNDILNQGMVTDVYIVEKAVQ
ncbi:hypothetical protein [Halalkalibacillus halophilus]|uniref:hypothetical protein n=1 Tax=Halalkalibacillus halophilus TaxID=392827 RepID=UPI00040213FA|nr:hypothetical protein [Halalkalibacillus halophilus]